MAPYGNYWKDSRRSLQQTFNAQAVSRYRSVELKAVHRWLRALVQSPTDFRKHNRLCVLYSMFALYVSLTLIVCYSMVGSTIVEVTYGIEVHDPNDQYITVAEEGIWIANQILTPGSYLVDMLPICTSAQILVRYYCTYRACSEARTRMVSWSIIQKTSTRMARCN